MSTLTVAFFDARIIADVFVFCFWMKGGNFEDKLYNVQQFPSFPSGQAKDCCMSYNNLTDLEAIELLLAGIVVFFATIMWKRQIFLHNLA
ncbi:hypothetical protein ASG85_24795 [Paenibacillus sp. Soil724D2]|nr:hypothetical protein ASG85_24795 [Paenibacillus sp. Soil724D2]